MTTYQLLPALHGDELDALRADIAAHGVRVPIDVDEHGAILDGHHRAALAAELGVDCPARLVAGLTEQEKRAHALAVNVHRRSLTLEQRRELVAHLRAEGLSVRGIATATGLPKSTVADDIAAQVSDSGHLAENVVGTDGKIYPASRSAAAPSYPEYFGDAAEEAFAFACADAGEEAFERALAESKAAGDLSREDILTRLQQPTPDAVEAAPLRMRGRRRRPWNEAYRDAVFELERAIERVARLKADDRAQRYAERGHAECLRRQSELLEKLAAELPVGGEGSG